MTTRTTRIGIAFGALVAIIVVILSKQNSDVPLTLGSESSLERESSQLSSAILSRDGEQLHGEVATILEAIGAALEWHDPQMQLTALSAALRDLNSENVHSVVAAIESQWPRLRENSAIYELVLRRWAAFDGLASVNYSMEALDGDLRLDGGVAALRSWAKREPAIVALHLQGMREAYGKDYLIYDYAQAYVDQHPSAALEWTSSLSDDYRSTAVRHAIRRWLLNDSTVATNWVALNTSSLRDTPALRLTAVHLARQGVGKVDAFVRALPAEDMSGAMVAAVDWLAKYQPNAVSEWLNQYESSTTLDPVFAAFSKAIATRDPESALSWADAIDDPLMRAAFQDEVHKQNGTKTSSIAEAEITE